MPRSRTASAFGLLASACLAAAGTCDVYASGGTPCVAAHSTTRSLYNSYNGPLYQVTRNSDGKTHDIHPRGQGGVANANQHDNFCQKSGCTITIIYDQSGYGNDLAPAPPGEAASGPGPDGFDLAADASAAPVYVNGQKAYGIYVAPGIGYRRDQTNGVATGNDPEAMYAVVDGTRYNSGCCFDYGNAETTNRDDSAGHMEAVYFGLGTGFGTGAGSGPWVLSDQENGLFSDSDPHGVNPNDPTITYRFVTAMVKGNNTNYWELKGGNAANGPIDTYYAGPRADGYYPMQKEGAIILGIGGDNSNFAEGTWYEGVMTSGFPSNSTDEGVQQNIVSAQYSTGGIVGRRWQA